MEGDALRHMNACYDLLKDWYCQKKYTTALLTRAGYAQRIQFGLYLNDGDDSRSSYLGGNTVGYKWVEKYCVLTVGEHSAVLVLCPPDNKKGVLHISAMRLEDLQKPTYAERLFADLWKIHQVDHCKGTTLFTHARNEYGNITREICKMFTDICLHWIKVLKQLTT